MQLCGVLCSCSHMIQYTIHTVPLQGVFTFLYISVLSHLGERFAVRLRTALFCSLVQQDIAFFDSHKTGELVNR